MRYLQNRKMCDNADMGHRLNGLGAGPAETAMPTIIADVIFLHDRGKYQTLYFAFYFGSLMVCFLLVLTSFTSLTRARLGLSYLARWRRLLAGETSGG